MSSTPGLPIGLRTPRRMSREVVYDHIPRLRELIPNGGYPGIVYVQSLVQNMKFAADRRERPAHLTTIQGTAYYTIQGPLGEAQMALLGSGEPILGASPESGERFFYTDSDVEQVTGLRPLHRIHLRPGSEDEDAEESSASRGDAREEEDREGDARVQGRDAALRVPLREEGDEPEAGHRDRDRFDAESVSRATHERIPKAKKFLKGHNHPANFGRKVEGCRRCDEIAAKEKRAEILGETR